MVIGFADAGQESVRRQSRGPTRPDSGVTPSD